MHPPHVQCFKDSRRVPCVDVDLTRQPELFFCSCFSFLSWVWVWYSYAEIHAAGFTVGHLMTAFTSCFPFAATFVRDDIWLKRYAEGDERAKTERVLDGRYVYVRRSLAASFNMQLCLGCVSAGRFFAVATYLPSYTESFHRSYQIPNRWNTDKRTHACNWQGSRVAREWPKQPEFR